MKLFFAVIIILWQVSATTAQAGAWLREQGTGFVSLSFGATQFSETTNAFYLEYGLTEKTTVGLDISAFTNSLNVRNGIGNLFIRRNLGSTDGPTRMACEVGVGGFWGNEMHLPTVRTGLSWGRGFQLQERSGWINVDGSFTYEPTLGEHLAKVDGTFGMEIGGITTGILGVSVSHQNDITFGSVEPSLLIKPKGSRFNFKFGAQIPFEEQNKSALKLGIWHNF